MCRKYPKAYQRLDLKLPASTITNFVCELQDALNNVVCAPEWSNANDRGMPL